MKRRAGILAITLGFLTALPATAWAQQGENGGQGQGNFQNDAGGGGGGGRGGRGGGGRGRGNALSNLDLDGIRTRLEASGIDLEDLSQRIREGEIDQDQALQLLVDAGVLDADSAAQLRLLSAGGGGGNNIASTVAQLQIQLSSPDDEWEILGPKVWTLVEATAMLSQTNSGGRGGRGGGGGGNQNPVAAAHSDLRDSLNGDEARITALLQAFRQAREQAEKAVQAAQEDLRPFLTVRQEAVLVILGYMD